MNADERRRIEDLIDEYGVDEVKKAIVEHIVSELTTGSEMIMDNGEVEGLLTV